MQRAIIEKVGMTLPISDKIDFKAKPYTIRGKEGYFIMIRPIGKT